MRMQALEFRKVSPEFQKPLEVFFSDLVENGIGHYFHPHPLSKTEAERVSQYAGQDLYYVAVIGNRVLGYGLLRGWDEGYTILTEQQIKFICFQIKRYCYGGGNGR